MPTPQSRPEIRALAVSLDAPALLPDGTRWSHAATFGSFRYRGETVTLDEATFESFARTLAAGGFPQKIPVDYDHGSMRADVSGSSPKAGDVLELRVVRSATDLPPTAADQIARAGRTLTDPRNFGLWARWRPTPRAEKQIRGREYTEMSIAYRDDVTNPRTGEKQGPTLLSIALLNTPHLDEMVPIAASRREGDRPDASEHPGHERSDMEKVTLLTRLGVALGRVFSNEEEATAAAESRITTLSNEVQELQPAKQFMATAIAELGVGDASAAIVKVKELKASVATAEAAAREARKTVLTAKRDEILKKHEDRYVPAEKSHLEVALMADLEAGRDTIEKMLGARPKLAITTRSSKADEGKSVTDDQRLDEKVKTFMRDEKLSYGDALEKAERELADERRAATTTA